MNILQLTQQVSRELGIIAPPAVVSSSDPQYQQFLAIAGRVGRDLVRKWEWQRLVQEATVTTVAFSTTGTVTQGSAVITGIPLTTGYSSNFGIAGAGIPNFAQIVSVDSATQVTMSQVATVSGTPTLTVSQNLYPLPSAWNRQIPQTEWDRTNRWPLNGPKSSQEWQNFKSGIVYAGPRARFQIVGQAININPNPPAGSVYAYSYVSGAWIVSAAGASKDTFTLDSDSPLFDDQLFICGMKLRWLQQKGLDYGYAMKDYEETLSLCKAQDKSSPKLSLSSDFNAGLLSNMNVPDGNFPS